MTSRTGSACRILGDFEKVTELRLDTGRVEMRPTSGEDGWFSLARRDLCGGCHTRCGRMTKPEQKECVSLSLCRRTFKLKGNKKFRTWTEKSLRVLRVLRFLWSVLYIYEYYMSISHMAVSGYGISCFLFLSLLHSAVAVENTDCFSAEE